MRNASCRNAGSPRDARLRAWAVAPFVLGALLGAFGLSACGTRAGAPPPRTVRALGVPGIGPRPSFEARAARPTHGSPPARPVWRTPREL
jgi:hypothetical protein